MRCLDALDSRPNPPPSPRIALPGRGLRGHAIDPRGRGIPSAAPVAGESPARSGASGRRSRPGAVIRVVKPGDSPAARARSQRGRAGADDSHLEAGDSRPGADKPRRGAADSHSAASDPAPMIRASGRTIRAPKSVIRLLKAAIRPVAMAIPTLIRIFLTSNPLENKEFCRFVKFFFCIAAKRA